MADVDNIFDVPEMPSTPKQPSEPGKERVETVEAVTVTSYVLSELTAAYPGWSAAYDDPAKNDQIIMLPICAMGMVTLKYEDGRTIQELRHFVALATGSIRDVFGIPDLICIIAPGQKVEDVVAAVKTERQMA